MMMNNGMQMVYMAGTWYIPYKATFWNRAKDANKGREAASSMVWERESGLMHSMRFTEDVGKKRFLHPLLERFIIIFIISPVSIHSPFSGPVPSVDVHLWAATKKGAKKSSNGAMMSRWAEWYQGWFTLKAGTGAGAKMLGAERDQGALRMDRN